MRHFAFLRRFIVMWRFLFGVLFAASDVDALTYVTHNGGCAHSMASWMRSGQETGGKIPETWAEMGYPGNPPEPRYGAHGDYVQPLKRYAFITSNVPLHGGRILLMMR